MTIAAQNPTGDDELAPRTAGSASPRAGRRARRDARRRAVRPAPGTGRGTLTRPPPGGARGTVAWGRVLDAALRNAGEGMEVLLATAADGRPDLTQAQTLARLRRCYLGVVTGSGALAGAAAAVPGAGTAGGLLAGAGDTTLFASASAAYTLAVATTHHVPVDDLQRRRALLLLALLGPEAERTIRDIAGRSGAQLGQRIARGIPPAGIAQVNRVLGRTLVTRCGPRHGALVLGKTAPFGIGALIGGAGNHALGRAVVHTLGRAFDPPPLDHTEQTTAPTTASGSVLDAR